MAIIRSIVPAALALAVTVFIPLAAQAKGPCDNSAAKAQITFQRHQLDEQRHQIQRQYRGHANDPARRAAFAQIEAQKDARENQKRALKEQKEECKEARKHYK